MNMIFNGNSFQAIALALEAFFQTLLKRRANAVGADSQGVGSNADGPGQFFPSIYLGPLGILIVLQD